MYGATDEVGHRAAEDVVTPNDFRATLLHRLGPDHERQAHRHGGRAGRLTAGRHARVVRATLA